MASPQSGIFVEESSAHWFQEYDIARSIDPSVIRSVLAQVATLGSVEDEVQIVLGVGSELAHRIQLETPQDFRAFATVGTGSRSAVATQHDFFLWFHGNESGLLFDLALQSRRLLTEIGAIVGDVPAFVYRDNRDLTGFIDGTENPAVSKARVLAVVDNDSPGAGGSIVLAQRWVHDLDSFHSLGISEQEKIIGRTKPDSIELSEEALPDTAHIARVVMEADDGEEIEIYRRSVPWGDSTEAGLMFVGFTDQLDKIDNMVRAMFGVDQAVNGQDGPDNVVYDRLIDFSTARTSSYYFAPSQETIAELDGP